MKAALTTRMKMASWKDTAELIGIAAIVGSLIFVGLQMRQDQAIARAAVWSETEIAARELSEFVNENREVWIRGLEGEELSELEELTFRAIAESIYNRHLALYQRAIELGTSSPESRIREYTFNLYQYPGLRQDFEQGVEERRLRRAAYDLPDRTSGFRWNVMKSLEQLDTSSYQIPEKSYLPF